MRVSEDRVDNHLVHFVWYGLDLFPYSEHITYYYMKLVYKRLQSDPRTTLFVNLKTFFSLRVSRVTRSVSYSLTTRTKLDPSTTYSPIYHK